MRKYFIDLAVGFVIGLIFFLGPGLFGQGGLLGWDFLSKRLPVLKDRIFLLGLPYVLGGAILFLLYLISPINKRENHINGRRLIFSVLTFSVGIYISYLIFLYVGAIAISRGGF